MADIGTVAAPVYADRAAFGVSPEFAQQLRSSALRRRRFGQQHDGAVQSDRQHIIVSGQRFEGRPVFNVGAEAADACDDSLAGFRMTAELAR